MFRDVCCVFINCVFINYVEILSMFVKCLGMSVYVFIDYVEIFAMFINYLGLLGACL